MPAPVVSKLREASQRLAGDPAVQETIARAGSPLMYMGAAAFQRYVDEDAVRMKDIAQKIGKVD